VNYSQENSTDQHNLVPSKSFSANSGKISLNPSLNSSTISFGILPSSAPGVNFVRGRLVPFTGLVYPAPWIATFTKPSGLGGKT